MFFAKPLQRSNLCASHRQRRWLTHGELINEEKNMTLRHRITLLSLIFVTASMLSPAAWAQERVTET